MGSPWLRIRVSLDFASPLLPTLLASKPYLAHRRRRYLSASASSAAAAAAAAAPAQGEVRVRSAPSPTGNLHVSGARTALSNYPFARFVFGFSFYRFTTPYERIVSMNLLIRVIISVYSKNKKGHLTFFLVFIRSVDENSKFNILLIKYIYF